MPILDVETGEVIKSANYRYRGEDIGELLEGMADIATQLTGESVNKTPVVTKPSSTPQPKARSSSPQRPRTVQSTPVVKYGPEKGAVIFNINVPEVKLKVMASNSNVGITSNKDIKTVYSVLENVGYTKRIELLSGLYAYTATKDGYRMETGTVMISPLETKHIGINLRSPAEARKRANAELATRKRVETKSTSSSTYGTGDDFSFILVFGSCAVGFLLLVVFHQNVL